MTCTSDLAQIASFWYARGDSLDRVSFEFSMNECPGNYSFEKLNCPESFLSNTKY